jgi:hypothetical protein
MYYLILYQLEMYLHNQTTGNESLVTTSSVVEINDIDWMTVSSILIGTFVTVALAVIGSRLYCQFR